MTAKDDEIAALKSQIEGLEKDLKSAKDKTTGISFGSFILLTIFILIVFT